MIRFAKEIEGLGDGELRAGGTDLMERRKSGRSRGDVVDLRDVPDLDAISAWDGGVRVGAKVPIATLAADARVPRGVALAAGGLATPQIRAVATVGGNLAQRVRCWYFRNPAFVCLQSGGTQCLARDGDHLFHGCFDTGACIAPHASTLACAFLAADATVELAGEPDALPIAEVLAALEEHAFGAPDRVVITAVRVPAPFPGERAAYLRAISRTRAEWPLVEVSARVGVVDGKVAAARVVVGGVANMPLRREKVEAALLGKALDANTIAAAAKHATDGAKPLPMTGYKLPLLVGTVQEALERVMGA